MAEHRACHGCIDGCSRGHQFVAEEVKRLEREATEASQERAWPHD